MALAPGHPITYWQVTELTEAAYDVADAPMEGKMDSTFFLTKDKNIIPHTYPCRTAYIAEVRDREPVPIFAADWSRARNVLPMGSAFLDLSGFWFRATRLSGWARTVIEAEDAGTARLRLGICGAAKLFVNGEEAGWLAPAARNAMHESEFDVELIAGRNEIAIWFEDLAERDAVLRILLNWVSGPKAAAAYPFDAAPGIVREVEAAIEEMHLDRKHYDNAEIWLVLPTAFPAEVAATIRVGGHFMSHDSQQVSVTIPVGATRVLIAHSAELPPDYRYFHFELSCDGFRTSAVLGAEVVNTSLLGAAPAEMGARIDEALHWIARNGETDTETALACLAIGRDADRARAAQIIETALPGIEACHDCADFALVPLLWGRIIYCERLPRALCDRIDAAALAYRYWMDEPGNDVQWYFSENHALLFHTAAYLAGRHLPDARFARSGRTGVDQSAAGLDRLRDWFDHFEAAEMAEFNSAPYFPIDLKGLTALFALAPDADIRERAQNAIARLVTIVANSAHQGRITGAQGRSYEHSLCATDTLELSGFARILWGKGGYGAHVNCLAQVALCLRDHGLILPDLTDRACWAGDGAQEWMFWQGQGGFARLYHYKTSQTALGSAALYRWGDWGYQETLIHARIGQEPKAQLWINHPGEMVQSGFGRPSFWGGSASVPRVQQYRDLAIVQFAGEMPQPGFTHCWFPTAAFDEWSVNGNRAAARSATGLVALRGSGPLVLQSTGGAANHELRLTGRDGMWIIRLGQGDDMSAFFDRHALKPEISADGTIVIDDPDYGPVSFSRSGTVTAEGRQIDPRDWTMKGHRNIVPLTSDERCGGKGLAEA
jgi:hypothetical protein